VEHESVMNKKKTILVIVALPEEFDVFQKLLPSTADHSTSFQVRLEHSSGHPDFRIISALSEQMGSQSALLSTEQCIKDFEPDLIVVLGIAGSLSSDACVGDVCISNEIIDVLHNSKVSGPTEEISLHPAVSTVDAALVSSFNFIRSHPNLKPRYDEWRSSGLEASNALGLNDVVRIDGPELLVGPIACGPVTASKEFKERIRAITRKVLAIETESGGVMAAARQYAIPTITIRGISDDADAKKADLELVTAGRARELAMRNATRIFSIQLTNPRFMTIAVQTNAGRAQNTLPGIVSPSEKRLPLFQQLESVIRSRLNELSPEFKSRPNGYYLPVPRVRRVSYVDHVAGRELDEPISILEAIERSPKLFIRLPRSYPTHTLGWALAYSFVRQFVGKQQIIPVVIPSDEIRPPNKTFQFAVDKLPQPEVREPGNCVVCITDEPPLDSSTRLAFLANEISNTSHRVICYSRNDEKVSQTDQFLKDSGLEEYELAPVSFTETAIFLERAFGMPARQAEAVAIKLDDTFRKFKLDTHPMYYSALQEDMLSAFIEANKRGELIQLAIDGLLTLVVASDRAKPRLTRNTRETFLRALVLHIGLERKPLIEADLLEFTRIYLEDFKFEVGIQEFLGPFYGNGILFRSGGEVLFAHAYLRGYLLAQALRENPAVACRYFDPSSESFDFYTFDLYCELGPAPAVLSMIDDFAKGAVDRAAAAYPSEHVLVTEKVRLSSLAKPARLASLSSDLVSVSDKMSNGDGGEQVREEKQRLIDARQHVRARVGEKRPESNVALPDDVKVEFAILDDLSRALWLTLLAIGSGAETLRGPAKNELAGRVLGLAEVFTDLLTRNRLRVDFDGVKSELLAEENVRSFLDQVGAPHTELENVRGSLELFLRGFELNYLCGPVASVLWRIGSTGCSAVLWPVVSGAKPTSTIGNVFKAAWSMDVDPVRGRSLMKGAFDDYRGADLFRLIVANHLLARLYWHHYGTSGSTPLAESAKYVLGPIRLQPTEKRIEAAKRGPKAEV
jgi:nucleoside phosphorylase